jgi:iron-sulfur cluster assembly protein
LRARFKNAVLLLHIAEGNFAKPIERQPSTRRLMYWGILLRLGKIEKVTIGSHVMTQATQSQQRGIQMTEAALQQVKSLREKQGKDLCLRVGVRQGGCSGMSYMMDFIESNAIGDKDEIYDYDGFQVVCDPKSILYIYGMVLDYSDALIGGGFQFSNPNAAQSCGCGKSFST